MNKIEIKKALYKQNPTAKFGFIQNGTAYYTAYTTDYKLEFEIPIKDMGEGKFATEEPAKLLIRWLERWL